MAAKWAARGRQRVRRLGAGTRWAGQVVGGAGGALQLVKCAPSLHFFTVWWLVGALIRWRGIRVPTRPSPCSGCLGGAAASLGSPVSGLCALVVRRCGGGGSGGGWGASKPLQMICWRRGRSGTEGGLWRPNGQQEADQRHGGSVLAPGGPAEPLVGLVGLSSRLSAPLPSIFPLLGS